MHILAAATFVLATIAMPGRRVEVAAGRSLHLVCEGTGYPTIVLESGSGEGWYTWTHVQKALSGSYRTCSYDRAGIGFSDPRDGRSIAALNEDLHELLKRSGEKGPYVLAGHSLGGILVRSYAVRYRSEVAGVVLVDSAHEEFERFFPPLAEETQRVQDAREARRKEIEEWRASGKWPQMNFHDDVPKELQTLLRPRSAIAIWWDARFTESGLVSAPLSDDDRRIHCPLAVVTAANWPRLPWRTEERHEAWKRARLESQKELASRSKQSHHIVANATHFILLEQPQVVIDAIREVARQVTP